MKKRELKNKDYIPEPDEIEAETNGEIDVKDKVVGSPGRVDFPTVEDSVTMERYEADMAQQAGRFSDQVITGSPAAEAGTTGKEALKDIIAASEKKLKEKLKD